MLEASFQGSPPSERLPESPSWLSALLVFGSIWPTPSLMIVEMPMCAALHPCLVVPWRENPVSYFILSSGL